MINQYTIIISSGLYDYLIEDLIDFESCSSNHPKILFEMLIQVCDLSEMIKSI